MSNPADLTVTSWRPPGEPDGDHAVVVGGGMAGLLAARVLAGHFERVTLVERDRLPESLQARKGVPQGRMLHVMLPCGQQIMERLFPGYSRPSVLFAPRVLAAAARPRRHDASASHSSAPPPIRPLARAAS